MARALRDAGREAASQAAGMASRTLERDTQAFLSYRAAGARIRITWPYYWAAYLHNGRGPMRAKRATHLIYFRNPDDDPRIGGPARNYPRKPSDVRRLTKEEFRYWQRQNALAPEGQEPMVVTRSVGPSAGVPWLELPSSPVRDFERSGADRAAEEAAREFSRLLDAEVSFEARTRISF